MKISLYPCYVFSYLWPSLYTFHFAQLMNKLYIFIVPSLCFHENVCTRLITDGNSVAFKCTVFSILHLFYIVIHIT